MVEVPSVRGQTPLHRIYDGVLHDVYGARHAGREEPLRPARQPVGFHQEASGEEPVVRRQLSVNHILCENMGAAGHTNTLLVLVKKCIKKSKISSPDLVL